MMPRLSPLYLGLGLGAVAACTEDQNPIQPGSGPEVQPTAPAVAALTSNTWTIKAAPAGGFMNGASAGLMPDANGNPVVYLLGGGDNDGGWSTPVHVYRVATNTWSSPGSQPRVDVFNSNGVGRIGKLLYISGGENFAQGGFGVDGRFFAYDPAKNTLTQKATPPKLTAEGVTGVIDGKLYVLPGVCDDDNYPLLASNCEFPDFRRLFRYNPTTNAWITKKQAPHFHRMGAGGVINGKLYVAGGRGTNVLDRYDPATDTWKTLAPIPVTAGNVTDVRGTALQGKLFVIASHFNQNLGRTLFDAFSYDPATNVWTRKARPTYHHSDIVAITWNGKPYLVAVGGEDANETPFPAELYTP